MNDVVDFFLRSNMLRSADSLTRVVKSMKLKIIDGEKSEAPWYAGGLKFTCTQCGNCCTGGPGYVWLTREEIRRLATFLKLTPEETVEKYCRKINGRFSLKEHRNSRGEYDCIFLTEEKVEKRTTDGEKIVLTRRGCPVYPVRPLQCRTWPFWPENLTSEEEWDHLSRRCHGMNHGRKFSLDEIHEIRDARDWPERPPTSRSGRGK